MRRSVSRRASIRTQSLSGSVPAWCPGGLVLQSLNRGLAAGWAVDPGGQRSHQDPAHSSSQATSHLIEDVQ